MKILVIVSGGLDSVTLLNKLVRDGHQCEAVSFDYGQKHIRELECARYWTTTLGIPHEVIRLGGVFSGSALTSDKPMPLADYSVSSMKATVVPNRNMVMLAVAVSKAIQHSMDAVAYGAHAGDREVYPDCREAFVGAMAQAITLCDWHPVQLLTPLLGKTKQQVVALARELGIDINLTWSCYEGGQEPCGKCGACRARAEAEA